MDIIGQNWIRFENNRKVKYRCSRSDFIVSGRFFDRGTWNYPEERFGRIENPLYFCTRRDGRVVDCGGLENRWAARLRGFESLSLRNKHWKSVICESCTRICTRNALNFHIRGVFLCPTARVFRVQPCTSMYMKSPDTKPGRIVPPMQLWGLSQQCCCKGNEEFTKSS